MGRCGAASRLLVFRGNGRSVVKPLGGRRGVGDPFEDAVTVIDHRLQDVIKVECFESGEALACDVHKSGTGPVTSFRATFFQVRTEMPDAKVDFHVGSFRPDRPSTCVFLDHGRPVAVEAALDNILNVREGMELLCRSNGGKKR